MRNIMYIIGYKKYVFQNKILHLVTQLTAKVIYSNQKSERPNYTQNNSILFAQFHCKHLIILFPLNSVNKKKQ